MPKGRRNAQASPRSAGKVPKWAKGASAIVAGLLAVILVAGLWLMSRAPEPETAQLPPTPVAVEAAEAVKVVDPFAHEALMSDDPVVVAGAVVDLRDEWFYAENDVLMASIDTVFGSAVSDGALYVLDGITLQRASLYDAPEPNKTYYHAEALSGRVLSEDEDGVLVEVWDVEVISRRNLIEPQAQWGRQRLMMKHDEFAGRWIVTDWTSVEGPVPGLTQGLRPSDATELEIELDSHARFRDWLGVSADTGQTQ